MTTNELTTASAPAIREHLQRLQQERAFAVLTGLAENAIYMEDLSDELEAVRSAYIGAAVTEIASLRAELGSPLLG
jgi:hypothetical protein